MQHTPAPASILTSTRGLARAACVACALLVAGGTNAGNSKAQVSSTAATTAQTANVRVTKLSPGMTSASLAGRPDTDLVEFADGRRMRVGELRRLSEWGRKARNTPRRAFPSTLRAKPAETGRRIDSAAQLKKALTLPDGETVRLASGRLATIGQIKLVMPRVLEKLGHPLHAGTLQPDLNGPSVKITTHTSRDKWKTILQQPDSTILEAPDGKRITVGMLRQALKTSGSARSDAPRSTAPITAPPAAPPAPVVQPR